MPLRRPAAKRDNPAATCRSPLAWRSARSPCFYLLFTAAVYHAVPWQYVAAEALARDVTAPGLLGYLLPPFWTIVIVSAAAVALAKDLPAMLLATSRLMFAWAEDGIFPKVVASVHPRHRTPHVAVIASGAMATLGVIGSHLAGDFFLGVDILVTAMLVNFLLMAVSVLTLPRHNPGLARAITVLPDAAHRVPLAVLAVVVIAGFLAVHTIKDLTAPAAAWYFRSTWLWAAVMAAGTIIYCARSRQPQGRRRRPARAVCGVAAGVSDTMAEAFQVPRTELAPGLTISRVLTGLWQLADQERDGRTLDLERTADAMGPYVAAGLTTFDMADHYGSAELVAGIFRSRHSGAAQYLTKWVPKPGRVAKADVRAAVERALQRLRTESIDLLQYHAWNYADPSWLETLYDLQDLKREGLIRQLGLTNVDTAHLRMVRASGIEVVSNQVSFSLLDQRAAAGLAPYCAASGVRLLAYGTVAGGWLTERWLGQPEPDWERTGTWSMMKYGRFMRVAGGWDALQRVLAATKRVADRHGVSIANIATRCILDHPGVAGVIVGARLGERAHIEDTVRLFSFYAVRRPTARRFTPRSRRCARFPATAAMSTARRRSSRRQGDLSHHLQTMPAPYESKTGADGRTRCLTGTVWETAAGFARAVRHGQHIAVSGTTATLGDRAIGGQDAAAQTVFAIDKIEGALQSLGGALTDVIRTRVYVRHVRDWEPVARAHGERFGRIQPANTLIGAELIGDEYLVEIEADAIVGV